MRVIWRCIFVTDVAMLAGLNRAIVFVVEWLGVTRTRVEQGLIVLYTACMVGNSWPSKQRWMLIAIELPIVAWMWWMHRKPSTLRMVSLLHPGSAAARVFSMVTFAGMSILPLLARWPGWFFMVGMNVLYVVIYYVLALPGGGEPGRRRKLALAKLKEMFGTSWMPGSGGCAMPMSFPDMKSLLDAASVWKFRDPAEGETEAQYREALADHVKPKDLIESQEIRTGKGWDQWGTTEGAQLLGHAGVIKTRAEHLVWAKERALEYVIAGDMVSAIASMLSDLGKHPELERSVATGAVLSLTINRRNPEEVRRWIEGFN